MSDQKQRVRRRDYNLAILFSFWLLLFVFIPEFILLIVSAISLPTFNLWSLFENVIYDQDNLN